jgi:hypothetical protein
LLTPWASSIEGKTGVCLEEGNPQHPGALPPLRDSERTESGVNTILT